MVSKKKNKTPDAERRRWPRIKASSVPFLKRVILGQGTDVQAINISRGGMLLETEVRLRPQMKISLKMVTSDGIIKMEGSVVRSSITSLTGTPKYQSAIEFDHPFHMLDDLSAEAVTAASEIPMTGTFNESSGNVILIAPNLPSAALLDPVKAGDF